MSSPSASASTSGKGASSSSAACPSAHVEDPTCTVAPDAGDIDHASLEAIVLCQLEDIKNMEATSKGKAKEDTTPSDGQVAFCICKEALERVLQVLIDGRIADSFYKASVADDATLSAFARAEEDAQRDRALALRLSGLNVDSHSESVSTPAEKPAAKVDAAVSAVSVAATASSSAARIKLPECVACMDKVKAGANQHVKLACDHDYCKNCISQLFTDACRDESLFPPRCCRQVISLSLVRPVIGEDGHRIFEKKSIELGTKDRLYCPDGRCATFIGPAVASDTPILTARATGALQRTCPQCGKVACAACKGPAHPAFSICRRDQDAESQAVLELARVEGWQRCPVCRHLVELREGCHHMTCICRTEFCFICNAIWPARGQGETCINRCALFDEDRLQLQAEAQARAQRLVNQPHAEAVARARQHILANHDCRHETGWTYRGGGGRCQECHFYLPQYLFRCRRCNYLACNRCRNNRL